MFGSTSAIFSNTNGTSGSVTNTGTLGGGVSNSGAGLDEGDPFSPSSLQADEGFGADGTSSSLVSAANGASGGILNTGTLGSSLGNLFSGIGKALGLGAGAAAGVASSTTPVSPLQGLGITNSSGQLTQTGTILLVGGAVLIAFSMLRKK